MHFHELFMKYKIKFKTQVQKKSAERLLQKCFEHIVHCIARFLALPHKNAIAFCVFAKILTYVLQYVVTIIYLFIWCTYCELILLSLWSSGHVIIYVKYFLCGYYCYHYKQVIISRYFVAYHIFKIVFVIFNQSYLY